jgi:hypothetical protein
MTYCCVLSSVLEIYDGTKVGKLTWASASTCDDAADRADTSISRAALASHTVAVPSPGHPGLPAQRRPPVFGRCRDWACLDAHSSRRARTPPARREGGRRCRRCRQRPSFAADDTIGWTLFRSGMGVDEAARSRVGGGVAHRCGARHRWVEDLAASLSARVYKRPIATPTSLVWTVLSRQLTMTG